MAYAPVNDIRGLREYVTGKSNMQQPADSLVLLHVTHKDLKARFPEIRLDLHMSVADVKHKLHTMCGTSPSTMTLHLLDESGSTVAVLSDDTRKLGYYSPRSGFTILLVDSDASSLAAQGWLEDVSKVVKYTMSEEAYSQRDNTYRKFKAERVAADPTWTLEKEVCMRTGKPYVAPVSEAACEEQQARLAASITVGQRCSVDPGERRGRVGFVGRVPALKPGHWVGVRYDEPLGRNDGSAGGVRYFDCPPGYGGFVRPDRVTVGDFPPLDDDLSDLGSGDEI